MKSVLQLNVISADKEIFAGEVTSVSVPGISGRFGIYPNHAPLISGLEKGTIQYTEKDSTKTIEVNGGIIEVNKGIVTICVV